VVVEGSGDGKVCIAPLGVLCKVENKISEHCAGIKSSTILRGWPLKCIHQFFLAELCSFDYHSLEI
jgi:hypothetical protein